MSSRDKYQWSYGHHPCGGRCWSTEPQGSSVYGGGGDSAARGVESLVLVEAEAPMKISTTERIRIGFTIFLVLVVVAVIIWG